VNFQLGVKPRSQSCKSRSSSRVLARMTLQSVISPRLIAARRLIVRSEISEMEPGLAILRCCQSLRVELVWKL
jgi:hypothetical protein